MKYKKNILFTFFVFLLSGCVNFQSEETVTQKLADYKIREVNYHVC